MCWSAGHYFLAETANNALFQQFWKTIFKVVSYNFKCPKWWEFFPIFIDFIGVKLDSNWYEAFQSKLTYGVLLNLN